jgi:hypothetical protein
LVYFPASHSGKKNYLGVIQAVKPALYRGSVIQLQRGRGGHFFRDDLLESSWAFSPENRRKNSVGKRK